MSETTDLKRCAIIGTAPSWTQAPWHDATLEMWTLNDGYMLGLPRSTRHYDLHPIHQMFFRPPHVPGQPASSGLNARNLPVGVYVRPEGHLQWLKTRPFPVYLYQPTPEYPTGRAFPRAELLEFFSQFWPLRCSRKGVIAPGPDYEVSTPSWMLMHAIADGYQEIHVYGIHLATEWEYVQQRPNFEFLLGVAAGLGRKVVLPDATPICKAAYRYAFEPKADIPAMAAQHAIQRIKEEGAQLHQRKAALPWYAVQQRRDVDARLQQLNVDLADGKQTLARAQVSLV